MAGFADANKLHPEPESGMPIGRRYEIAVMAWFTQSGLPLPISFKFKDDEDEIQTVRDICVQYKEQKNYSRIPSIEYHCEAVIGGLIHIFRLIFYKETCQWVMFV